VIRQAKASRFHSDAVQRQTTLNTVSRSGAMPAVASNPRFSHDFSRIPVQNQGQVSPFCKGKAYDPATQCCEEKGVLPKKPIANLADCPRRTADPTHKPSSNGCTGVPNNPNAVFGDFSTYCALIGQAPSFVTACDFHDICYDTCNKPKTTCDEGFLSRMMQICSGLSNNQCRSNCESNAVKYFGGVSAFDSFYEDAQKAACKCCP
jgi:hypothetical protein